MTDDETQRVAPRMREPVLIIDSTTAHVVVDPRQAEALLGWLCGRGIGCELRRPGWPGGPDLIDFGDPSPTGERCIRTALARWRQRGGPA